MQSIEKFTIRILLLSDSHNLVALLLLVSDPDSISLLFFKYFIVIDPGALFIIL